MTLADYMNQGGNPDDYKMCQVEFVRTFDRKGTGRFEGIDPEGKAIVRYNGVNEQDWYLPYVLDPAKVTLVVRDGKPVPYDARPLTQR